MIMKFNSDILKKERDSQSLHGKVPAVSEYEGLVGYSSFRAEVTSTLADVIQTKAFDNDRIHHLLNGGASKALQEHIARETRLKFGMFFSGQRLASSVADMIQHKILQGAVLADPACGAGDLLLACLSRAPIHSDLQSTLTAWGERTLGLDIHEELAETTRVRIALLAATRLCEEGRYLTSHMPNLSDSFAHIRSGDYFAQQELSADADCVVMNPPFTEINAPEGCSWSSGKVQQAAVFMAAVVAVAKVDQEIVAVLPDVLRSGTRYDCWRQLIAESSDVLAVDVFGRFDSKTDVDVFILHLRKRGASTVPEKFQWKVATPALPSNFKARILSEFFKVSVGAVVPHRHKNEGQWAPYVDVSSAPANNEVNTFNKRRFKGTLHKGPFVALRRTSSPSDPHRAVGSLINTNEYVAVENHLIVLQPHDGTLKRCRQLMDVLHQPYVDKWLNATIRCRHLTTKAIAELPIGDWQ